MWPDGDIKQANHQEVRKLSIQSCIQSLVHASRCDDANCRLPSCQKMKRVVTHTKICKRKTKGNCPICKQLIALCCWHAKRCRATECSVPFCSPIKQKMKQYQVQLARLSRRRVAAINPASSPPPPHHLPSPPPSKPNSLTHSDTNTHTLLPNVQKTSQMITDFKQATLRKARIVSIQSCIQSLVHAWQCRDANCRLPSCQKMKRVVTHTKICKRKTKGNCPICKQLITLCCYHVKHCQETMCSVPFCSSIKQKLKQQQVQQRVQQAKLLSSPPPPSKPNTHTHSHTNTHTPIHNVQKALQQQSTPVGQGWQQLIAKVRSPTSHKQQQEILQILKSNPPLMAAFIKQRLKRLQETQFSSQL